MDMDQIARVCHEVNKAYCKALGDNSQPTWEDAPEWQRSSARMGVDLHTMGNFGPEASHISWMKQKVDEGWVYGPVKDPEAKTHRSQDSPVHRAICRSSSRAAGQGLHLSCCRSRSPSHYTY